MIILGLNAYHADAAAAIVVDGKLVAAVEEERFRRMKHWAGFPSEAVRYCLSEAGISINDVDHVAVSRDPKAHFWKKALFALGHRPKWSYLADRMRNRSKVRDIERELLEVGGWRREGKESLSLPPTSILKPHARIHHVEHHRAHMASGFFVSPFDEAAVISMDALGDFASAMWGEGEGKRIKVKGKILFPHSLGFLYTAATQYLGFPNYGDEYKVMGLAAYGEPEFLDAFRKIIRLKKDGAFELDLSYFRHHSEGVSMTWDGGEPVIGPIYSDQWEYLLGPARKPGGEITKTHQNLAASLQAVFEEVYFSLLNKLHERTQLNKLCLSGGCAMNSVANGKIFNRTPFTEVYIQSAAGDAGTAIGSAFHVQHQILNRPRSFVMNHSFWGPRFGEEELREALGVRRKEMEDQGCSVTEIRNEDELCRKTAAAIADGKIVGWFQGRMEWGPRALGHRSILADPRRADIREVLNTRIKRRETFRPFAPSILIEAVGDYFEKSYPDPFMLKVYPIKKEKRPVIPAVTHVDGTGRLQTVDRESDPRYWKLIKNFEIITGVP
ncbi:MAG: carbamoyltransferase, partial [Nitrospirae bacterium]|nr:carbamoyltransferase [Nitrospirota bacterium]